MLLLPLNSEARVENLTNYDGQLLEYLLIYLCPNYPVMVLYIIVFCCVGNIRVVPVAKYKSKMGRGESLSSLISTYQTFYSYIFALIFR